MPVNLNNLDDVFTYHAPTAEQIDDLLEVRTAAKAFAAVICIRVPNCADQQAALRHVREAVMTANAAIVLRGLV